MLISIQFIIFQLFMKKVNKIFFLATSLLDVVKKYTLRSKITSLNGSLFNGLFGFGMLESVSTSFYIVDHTNDTVFKLDDTWAYVGRNSFYKPTWVIVVSSSLYISGDSNIYKVDNNLNVLKQYNASITIPFYRGIYYDPADYLIYAASPSLHAIHVFDLNLSLNGNISTSTYEPRSIVGYNSKLYVGTTVGTILLILNRAIINSFDGCLGNSTVVTSILFDQFGYMATICNSYNRMYLYHSNGTYVGKSLATVTSPYVSKFDSIGRFIIVSWYQISFYY